MEEGTQLLGPSEQVEVFNEKVREMMPMYCCLTAVAPDGRGEARGTGVFVRRYGATYVATAQHVLSALRGGARMSLAPRDKIGRAVVGTAVAPVSHDFMPIVVYESKLLDVALLKLSSGIADLVGFFDIDDAYAVESWLRENWRTPKVEEKETSLPYFILGFPGFGSFVYEELKVELNASIPLQGYLVTWDESGGGNSPQMTVALEAHRPEHVSPDLSPFERSVAKRLFSEAVSDFNPFGGYSGGPLVLITPEKNHLIGFVKEGGRMFGEPRIFASTLFDFLRESGL